MTNPKDVTLTVEFGKNGLPFIEPIDGARLDYTVSENGNLSFDGNSEGLLILAKALVGMAHCKRNDGYHVHLDDLYELNDDENFITINKTSKE